MRKRQIPKGKRKKSMMLMIALAIVVNPPRDRTLSVGPRTDAWIALVCNEFSEKQWYENFHLSKGTVLYIVNELEGNEVAQIRNYGKRFLHFSEWL